MRPCGARRYRPGEDVASDLESIYGPLNAVHTGRSTRLERMAREVMDADGIWKRSTRHGNGRIHNAFAAEAVLPELAQLLRCAPLRRRAAQELLEAASGFLRVCGRERKTDLLIESLLGRALCHLDLGTTMVRS